MNRCGWSSSQGRVRVSARWDLTEPDPMTPAAIHFRFEPARAHGSNPPDAEAPDKLFLVAPMLVQDRDRALPCTTWSSAPRARSSIAEFGVGFNMASGSAKLLTQLVGLAKCPPARPVRTDDDGKEASESAWR